MRVIKTRFKGLFVIKGSTHFDNRGFLRELFEQKKFSKKFVFDYFSVSKKNVIRGLHLQLKNPQTKIISVISGKIFDVVVDLRKTSSTFAKWICVIICSEKKNQIWIPPGFAHGFLAKTNDCEVLYKTTEYYFPEYEKTIIWNDPTLNIDWGIENPKLSIKDLNGKFFKDSYYFENY